MDTNQPSLISIITLLKSSINLLKSNIRLFTGLAGIFLLLNIAVGYALVSLGILGEAVTHYDGIETGFLSLIEASTIFLKLFLIFMGLVAYAWFSGSLTIAVREIVSGKVITIKEALKDGWIIKWSFLFVIFLVTLLVISGVMILLGIIPSIFHQFIGWGAGIYKLLMFLLIIPGGIFWYFLCTYALVCENLKGTATLSRGGKLVRGHWWSVTIRVMPSCVILGSISFIISIIPFFGKVMNVLFYLIALPFITIYFFILYKNLKTVKD